MARALREEGRTRGAGAGAGGALAYHPGLNVLLLAAPPGALRALDAISGATLHQATPGNSSEPIGIQFLPKSEKVVIWDSKALAVRSAYNGVLLLHTALQQLLQSSNTDQSIKIELFLSEAILLYQCMKTIELASVDYAAEFSKALGDAIEKANELPKKGIKAQKWSTICLELPHISLKMMANTIVSELKQQKRHVPALAIASALNQQVSDLIPSSVMCSQQSQETHNRELMFSEATRRETFKKWPHMDYKWALPAEMAQAGFFYQPANPGDDRVMCFSCGVSLVCWEKTDEPWSEHERHSPDCPLVKGEYTHNVPLSVTDATSPAIPHPGIAMVSRGNLGDIFLTGSTLGKVSIWNVDCKLKLQQDFTVSVEEPLLQSKLYGPYSSVRKAWENSSDHENELSLTTLTIVGRCQNKEQPCSKDIPLKTDDAQNENQCLARPSIVCGVKINAASVSGKTTSSIWNDTESGLNSKISNSSTTKAAVYSTDGVKAMNDQNQAKSNNIINSSYLIVYDFQGKCSQIVSPLTNSNGNMCIKNGSSKSGGSKKCEGITNHTCRTEDANIYDDIYLSKYMCLDDELSPEMTLMAGIHDQVTVIDFKSLVAQSSKELESKFGPPHEMNTKSSGIPSSVAKNSLQSCIKFISKVNIGGAPQNPLAIHPYSGSQGSNVQHYDSSDKITKPYNLYDSDNHSDVKITDAIDAIVLDTKSDGLSHELACITELMYEYKNSGIKMKVPYCKPSTTKNVNTTPLINDSPEKETTVKEDVSSPPTCRAVQCVQLPSDVCARSDLTISHVVPSNNGEYLLVVVSCETVNTSDKTCASVNGSVESMELDDFESNLSSLDSSDADIYGSSFVNMPTSFLILYALKFDSSVTLINESPICIKEITYNETPIELCLLPNSEKTAQGIGLVSTVGRDGVLRLLDITSLESVAEAKVESSKFLSVIFCSNTEKLCACTEKGTLHFYAVGDSESDSTEEIDEEDIYLSALENSLSKQIPNSNSENSSSVQNQSTLIAYKNKLNKEDFNNLVQLAGIDGKGDNVVAYTAVVPSCWSELLPTQRSRADNQHFYRSWRLQNTSSTWDEHVLELSLPWSISISHVELKFTLHAPCTVPPNIQVTLLKQHLHGIGYRKESPKYFTRIDDQIDFILIDEPKGPAENPVRSKEYLGAQNAEILAGPLTLAQDLDLTQQAGTLTLTSPRLYRARGKNLLIHIKTLFDPSKDIHQGKVSSKKSKTSEHSDTPFAMPNTKKKVESYIGCDWLHEISITVRSNKHTSIPQERLQRIAMLESNYFFENLLNIAANNSNREYQSTALDLLIWIVSIRLTRYRSAKSDNENTSDAFYSGAKNKNPHPSKTDIEHLQHDTVKHIQQNMTTLVKKCILLSKRSISKKCVKLILICCKGVKNLDNSEVTLQFEMAILESITSCLPLIGLVQSAGSLGWFTQLVMRSVSFDADLRCATVCMQLLEEIASIMQSLYNPYHLLLRSRFGLYGLPMESTLFDIEPPALGKTLSVPLTYSTIVAGDTGNNQVPSHQEIDLRDLYNYTGKSSTGWWCNESSICGNVAGLGEVMPLRVIFHNASDGTHLEDTASTHQSCPSFFTINSDYPQFWDTISFKNISEQDETSSDDHAKAGESETIQNDKLDCALIDCEGETSLKSEDESQFQYKDGTKCPNGGGIIPWQLLVQQPPQQMFVIKRMHPGARHFIVLDFGYPIKLTDLIIPCCPEVVTLSIDIWLNSEDQDCTRLVLAPDISTKNLVMTDIQPPPLCQYLKITTIGRYNMSTTRCKIPLGWFYGEIADSVVTNENGNISNLMALHQDLSCRFRLAVGKLTDCLDFYLEMSGGNASHITADTDQQNENYPLVRTVYQECLEIQQQITSVERIMERFNIASNSSDNSGFVLEDLEKQSSKALLKRASVDKLKTITEQLTDVLLYICFECDVATLKRFAANINMSACAQITKWLIVCGGGGGPRLEAGLASVLVRLCSSQSWWGTFIADTLAQLYSPSNTLIFSQNRVLILLVFMGRKSLTCGKTAGFGGYNGGVVECVSQLVTRLLPTSDTSLSSTSDPVWQTTDLALLGWLLIYLSACLDTAQPKDGSANSWSRWSFLSVGNGGASSNNSGNNAGNAAKSNVGSISRFHKRKLQKRLVHKVPIEELEAVRKAYQVSQQVQALSALSSQAANLTQPHSSNLLQNHSLKNPENFFKPNSNKSQWVKRFEEFIQNRLSLINKPRIGGSSGAPSGSSRLNGSAPGTSVDNDAVVSDGKPSNLISQQLALQVSRSLISLILSMDFTCNSDVLLLACKVIGRLNGICGGLSTVVKEHEVLELMRAACSPAPWHQHPLLMLLQDLIEYDRTGCRSSDSSLSPLPVIQTDASDDSAQWQNSTLNTFSNSDNRNDAISADISIAAIPFIQNKDDGTAASSSADYLIESDDDFDLDDLFDELPERTKHFHKDVIPKPTNNNTLNGASIAVDSRLGSGIEMSGEILIRRLALLGGGSLASAIHAQPVPSPLSILTTPSTEHVPLSTTDLTNMLISSFNLLFCELELQDNSMHLERVLQLWITLNGCSCGVAINNGFPPNSLLTPKIKLSSQAITSVIHALNHQMNVSLRCWVLAFQCLSWVSNSSSDSPLTESTIQQGMAGVMLDDPQFTAMLVKFLSSNMESDLLSHGGEKPCVGPVACATLTCLLRRISARSPISARGVFLRALCQLAGQGGALRYGRGPPDAQKELLHAATSCPPQYSSSHLPEAMSLIESLGVIVTSSGNIFGVEVYGIGESASSVSSIDLSGGTLGGGMILDVLTSSEVRREKPASRRDLIISLIIFAKSLISVPLTDPQMENEDEATIDESQTDESKASQQNTLNDKSNSRSSPNAAKIPCLADIVLQHNPTMKRVLKALSACSITLINISGVGDDRDENLSFGDALFRFVMSLVLTASHPKLVLTPLLDYLVQGAISEAVIKFILRSLEVPEALEIFVALGGIEIICSRLIASHKNQLSPQPGLVAALMNHLKQPTQLINLSTITPTNAEKAQQTNMEISEGLLNYAPLGTITSGHPAAQQADALLTVINSTSGNCGGGGAHRRTRSAAWSHHFSRGETSIDLSVKLPHAILLHEVQLQPHTSTLSTCPSAVSLEVCAQGCVMTPLGPPLSTAGMTYIRLKLTNPIVVNTVLIRLYKPRDNSNMGLLNMRILGTAAFSTPAEKIEEKLAGTSAGWSLILWQCLCGGEGAAYSEARQRASLKSGLAEAVAGLLLSASAPSSIIKTLLLALGSEPSTALRVLSLILYNGHIPTHKGYHSPSTSLINSKTPVDSVCDLLYQLCTIQDTHSSKRISTFIDWLKDCGEMVVSNLRHRTSQTSILTFNISHTKYLSPMYIQCLASILWTAKEHHVKYNMKELITKDLFDTICTWIELLPKYATVKRSLNSVLCSMCYIRPDLFTRMLQKMGVLVADLSPPVCTDASISDDRKNFEAKEAMTDDKKVTRENNPIFKPASLENLNLSSSQLMTISAACMSPKATKMLLKSELLLNVTKAIEKFCIARYNNEKGKNKSLTDSDKSAKKEGLMSMEMMPILVEWLSCLCIDSEIKNWLGGPSGSCFWKPLLMMLCLPKSKSEFWHKNELYTQLEEKTIKLFGALTSCNSTNQKLFAKTLYDVIKCHPETSSGVDSSISGFTRGLLLRLLLRSERVSVAIRMKGDAESLLKDTNPIFNQRAALNGPLPPRYLANHPSLYGCILLSLPYQTLLSDIIVQHILFRNVGLADGWEMSVTPATTAKDKRTKDVRSLCAKHVILHIKKKGSSQKGGLLASKKEEALPGSNTSVFNTTNSQEPVSPNSIKIFVNGIKGHVTPNASLGTLCASTEYKFGANLNITIISPYNDSANSQSALSEAQHPTLLSIFAGVGGLALLARHLPPVCPPLPLPSQPSKDSTNTDEWVKLEDVYEDVTEASSNSTSDESSSLVPAHSLVALGLLLRLPGYAEALLKEGQRAVYLLRLLLGVMDDGEGKEIMAVCGAGLGTLSFRVLGTLLESLPLSTDDGMLLRSNLLQTGTLRLLLLCLAVFTHQQPDSPPSEANPANGGFSKSKAEEKSKLYWAKGTGFGTGSTQQSWNVEESLMRQKTEEEHVTVLLQVIASYIQPGERWNIGGQASTKESNEDLSNSSTSGEINSCLPPEFFNIIHRSALLPAISSYLRNDSVLDMSRHIPLYLAVMKVVRAVMTSQTLCSKINSPSTPVSSSLAVIPPLLNQMSNTVDTYAKKLKMNKKTAYTKNTSSATDGCEDDEGLALLIPDIQATSALVQNRLGMCEGGKVLTNATVSILRAPSTATREARYLEVMKRLQFETFEMIGECPDNGYKFNVSYHFESNVRAAGDHSHPARMKRLAQEAVTLSTSLPLSYSSSVFVRTDQDRLDIMKVLITGPSDTPYANGCFVLDVYFPIDYPNTPMLINLETTGRHSVRFNPNLYLDGKVCLSVLNTWHGRPEEQWNAQTSSFLQVLVSIQSLILVPEPYFNEPGFERSRGTPGGTHHSLEYNSNIYQACVRWAMLEQLRNPASCFQQVIRTHFWLKRDEICSVIEGWIEELEMQAGDKRTQRNIRLNMMALKRHYKNLREELVKLTVPPGLEDLETPFSATTTSRDSPAPTSSPPNVTNEQQNQDMDVDMDQLIKKMVSEVCE